MYLEGYNSTTIRNVIVNTTADALTSSWDVSLKIYFENNPSLSGTVKIDLNTDVTIITEVFAVTLNSDSTALVNFTIPAVKHFKLNKLRFNYFFCSCK